MKFDFSLQSVLDVESQLEKIADLKLAEANAQLNSARDALHALHEQIADRQQDLASMTEQNLHSFQSWNAFVGFMNLQMEKQKHVIQECEHKVREVLRVKIFHKQRIEGLVALRENEVAEYKKQASLQDQKTMLEVVLQNQMAK